MVQAVTYQSDKQSVYFQGKFSPSKPGWRQIDKALSAASTS